MSANGLFQIYSSHTEDVINPWQRQLDGPGMLHHMVEVQSFLVDAL